MKHHACTISIGGIPVLFSMLTTAMYHRIRRRYRDFLVRTSQPHLRLRCSFLGNTRREGTKDVEIRRTGRQWRACREDFECRWFGGAGTLRAAASIYSFDACIRVLWSILLRRAHGLFVHASGVATPKGGFLFAGVSGSGKTTVAKLSAPRRVLNDEICAVTRIGPQSFSLWGTPFWGEMQRKKGYCRPLPLRAIYFLNKSTGTRALHLQPDLALRRLLRCVCLFDRDSDGMQRAMNCAARLLQTIPSYRLLFEKSPELWTKIDG